MEVTRACRVALQVFSRCIREVGGLRQSSLGCCRIEGLIGRKFRFLLVTSERIGETERCLSSEGRVDRSREHGNLRRYSERVYETGITVCGRVVSDCNTVSEKHVITSAIRDVSRTFTVG